MRRVLSIIPYRIHAESRRLDVQVRHPCQKLIVPSIDLHPSVLVIGQRQPFITPVAGADGVGVTPTVWRRVQADLALDVARGAEAEGRDIAGQRGGIGPRGREEVLTAVGGENHVRAIVFRLYLVQSCTVSRVGGR